MAPDDGDALTDDGIDREDGPLPETEGQQRAGPPRFGPVVRFGAVAIIATGLLVLTYLILVTTEPGQRIENLALLGAELRSNAEREAALGRLSVVTVAIFALALVAVVTTGFLRGRERLALVVAMSMVGAVVIAELLKVVLPRPALIEGPVWLLRNSFPSGSAAVAASIAIGALLVAPDRLRWMVLLAGVVFAALIGESVQTTGWHRLSDTVGGVLIVIAVSAAGLVLLASTGFVAGSDAARIDARFRAALVIVAAGAVVLGIGLALLPAVFPLLAEPAGARRSILQTAFPLVGVGVTVLATVAFARVIEPYSLGLRPGRSDRPEHDPR